MVTILFCDLQSVSCHEEKKMLLKFHLPLLKIHWYPEAHFRENYIKIEIFQLVVAEWGRGGEVFL